MEKIIENMDRLTEVLNILEESKNVIKYLEEEKIWKIIIY